MRLCLLPMLASVACAADWSFREFLAGEWDMERQAAGTVDHAHYSLKAVGASLEGTYHEDGEFGPTNEMLVRVLFDDASGKVGSFQLAKAVAPKQPEGDEPPTPQLQPEPKSAFDFDFRAQSDGRFHLSESRWLGKAGGTVQFLASEDAFVFTKVVCTDASTAGLTSWTAARRGAKPAGGSGAKEAGAKRSMLQRYGWYLMAAMTYAGYKVVMGMVVKAAGGAAKKKS